MQNKRRIEIFTAGCPICDRTVKEVKSAACPSCEIKIYDLGRDGRTDAARQKARDYGVKSVPAVAIDGKLASCCSGNGVEIDTLKKAGLGQPL